MIFMNPWGLLGLISLPVIVAIHLFQRRFPRLPVAGLHLWGVKAEIEEPGRKRERLPITPSLLLELLAAVLLTLLLSQPRFGTAGTAAHLVIVLDNSASMQAVVGGAENGGEDERESFRDAAIAHLDKRFSELPAGSVATIILTGQQPVMFAGPAMRWSEAKKQLKHWQPSAMRHDFQPAWDLAAQFAAKSGRLLFLTDRLPDDAVLLAKNAEAQAKTEGDKNSSSTIVTAVAREVLPKRMEVVAVGQPVDNVAFTAARWTIQPVFVKRNGEPVIDGYRGNLFFRVANFGSAASTVTITGESPAKKTGTDKTASIKSVQTVFQKTISLSAHATKTLNVTVPGGVGRLTIRLVASQDALAIDNELRLIEPMLKPLKVAVTLPDDSSARKPIQRILKMFPQVQFVPEGAADLIIGSADSLPPSRDGLWWFGIGPLKTVPEKPRSENTDSETDSEKPKKKKMGTPSDHYPYIIEKQHPLLDGITLDGVKWSGVQPVRFAGTPLISAGPHPLLLRLNGTLTNAFLLNIDLELSTLTTSGDWPVLMQNLIKQCRGALPGLSRWNYRCGEEIRLKLPPQTDVVTGELTLVPLTDNQNGTSKKQTSKTQTGDESTASQLLVTQLLVIGQTAYFPSREQQVGLYEIRRGEKTLERVAVNFIDAKESVLQHCLSGEHTPELETPPDPFRLDEPHSWLILFGVVLLIGLLFLDWWFLRKKRSLV